MNRWAALLLVAGSCAILQAGPVPPIAQTAVANHYRPLPYDNQRLAGLLAVRMRANSEGFLESLPLQSLSETPGANGLFLSAGAKAYQYHQDATLRARMDQVLGNLLKSAASDGYLGLDKTRETPEDFALGRLNLLGLLEYYRATGEETAYSAAQKMGDLLVKSLTLQGKTLQGGATSIALCEPLVLLYEYTAEPAYLELAKSLAQVAPFGESESGTSALLADAALVDLYRATSNARFLQAAQHGWQSSLAGALLATGVPRPPGGQVPDQCYTAAWFRLTASLFRITGEAGYGDALEKALYNELFAAQNGRTGDLCLQMTQDGRKKFLAPPEAATHLCTLALSETIASVPEAIWGRWGSGIAVNLYSGGRASVQLRRRALVQIFSETNYPERGDLLLHIEPSHAARFPLRLRVPRWCRDFTVDYAGGSHILGKAGEFLVIDREWKRGDTVRINMQMKGQAFAAERAPDAGGRQILMQRGPQLLVLGRTLNPKLKDLKEAEITLPENGTPTLKTVENRLPGDWAGDEEFETMGIYDGSPVPLLLTPLSDALDYVLYLKSPAPGANPGSVPARQ